MSHSRIVFEILLKIVSMKYLQLITRLDPNAPEDWTFYHLSFIYTSHCDIWYNLYLLKLFQFRAVEQDCVVALAFKVYSNINFYVMTWNQDQCVEWVAKLESYCHLFSVKVTSQLLHFTTQSHALAGSNLCWHVTLTFSICSVDILNNPAWILCRHMRCKYCLILAVIQIFFRFTWNECNLFICWQWLYGVKVDLTE